MPSIFELRSLLIVVQEFEKNIRALKKLCEQFLILSLFYYILSSSKRIFENSLPMHIILAANWKF